MGWIKPICSVRAVSAVGAALALFALAPAGAAALPPENDDYLKSTRIADAGGRVPRQVVKDRKDTREATTQTDLFSPQTGGGPEGTRCREAAFGKTVWYDLHPDQYGTAEIQTAGFDAAIVVYEFDPRSSRIKGAVQCSNEAGLTEDMFLKVKKGGYYTIQIGGVDSGGGPAAGDLQFNFQFFADRDRDGIFDPLDRCPTEAGVNAAGGCPPELRSRPLLSATPVPGGVILRSLSVSAPRGARVLVRCRRGCSLRSARTAGTVRFSDLRGRMLRAGAVLEVLVTKRGSIGNHFSYEISNGNFRRVDRCLKPGSTKPRKRCT